MLITGETGTGKEMLSRIVHELSHRSDGPFVAINIGAFSKNLVEDELFGHVKGAFTGATNEKKGFLEKAQGGSLFLDEITEMDQDLQGKLLRVIQERELYRLGSTRIRNLDVRIIAATNRNLFKEIEQGRFRKDLYYRLNVCHIHIPPLRKRKDDILPLANHFMRIHTGKNRKEIESLSPKLTEYLLSYSFPGNIREMENIIATCVLNEKSKTLNLSSAGDLIRDFEKTINTPNKLRPLYEVEKQYILDVLESTGGNRTRSAKILGIGLRTLQRKLKEYKEKSI
jgi:transcriptional regulator with PAS, ATPase and Fis domain